MSYACPYPDELLDKWDGVCNPIGRACQDCENHDCEHNPNPDPSAPWYDPYHTLTQEADQ